MSIPPHAHRPSLCAGCGTETAVLCASFFFCPLPGEQGAARHTRVTSHQQCMLEGGRGQQGPKVLNSLMFTQWELRQPSGCATPTAAAQLRPVALHAHTHYIDRPMLFCAHWHMGNMGCFPEYPGREEGRALRRLPDCWPSLSPRKLECGAHRCAGA